MLLELLKIKREAIRLIGEDAAVIGEKLGIKPSWIVYEKTDKAPRITADRLICAPYQPKLPTLK